MLTGRRWHMVIAQVCFALTAVSVKINCEMPTRAKTSFKLLDCEQELRQTALPTFEDVVKSSCST